MAFRDNDLGHLVRVTPRAAAMRIRVAYLAVGRHKQRAADALGIGRRSFDRYVGLLDERNRALALAEDVPAGGIPGSRSGKATEAQK